MRCRWLGWTFSALILSAAAAGCSSATSPAYSGSQSGSNNSSNKSSSSSKSGSSSHPSSSGSTGTGTSTATTSAPPAGSNAGGQGPYKVSGNQVLDKNGNEHFFRGVDRPSLEWSCSGDIQNIDYQAMAQIWNANVVRISLNQDCWLNDSTNPSYDSTYAGTVDQQVQWAEQNGMDIILDLHWSDKGDYSVGANCLANQTTTNCQQDMADTHSNTFWQQVATKYKGDPSVLFELYNEPRVGGSPATGSMLPDSAWVTWLNGGTSSGFTVVGMQQLYTTIRGTGANNLVIAGGLNWAFDLSGVPNHPISGTNVMYATHPYQSKGSSSLYPSFFGNVTAMYPVIATEFGNTASGQPSGCDANFDTTLLDYMDGKSGGIPHKMSWTAWAFYQTSSCSFPPLLADSNYDPNNPGKVVQAALMAAP